MPQRLNPFDKTPSNAALTAALIAAQRVGYPFSAERDDLERMRELRTTWFDREELTLRNEIDAFLER
jgi:hypothetical protein